MPLSRINSGSIANNAVVAADIADGSITPAKLSVTPGTSGNVLTSNGTSWVSQAAAAFDVGTRLIFAQTNAPTGWTKDTTNYNNHALRVVTGAASTGGVIDFTSVFANTTPTISVTGITGSAGATTLTTAQIPSHTHTIPQNGCAGGIGLFPSGSGGTVNSGATGGGGSHTHSFSFSSGTATSSAIALAVKYLDVITATKN